MNFQRGVKQRHPGGGRVSMGDHHIYNDQKQDNRKSKIYQSYRRRDMITTHELEAAIKETAEKIAQVEPDPENWEPWAVYLLESLEQQATAPRRKKAFERMLKKFAHDVARRANLGSW